MVKNMFPAGRVALLLAVLGAVCLSVARAQPGRSFGAGSDRPVAVVADWHTGLALYGFDPVAYFVDAQPVAGIAKYERTVEGATWRVRNAGNLAAFEAHADVYVPRFGGYDPLAVARGVATAGNPFVWLVAGERLYLFHDPAGRAAFVANQHAALVAATAHWGAVKATLPLDQDRF
jgi:hypothetical protein